MTVQEFHQLNQKELDRLYDDYTHGVVVDQYRRNGEVRLVQFLEFVADQFLEKQKPYFTLHKKKKKV